VRGSRVNPTRGRHGKVSGSMGASPAKRSMPAEAGSAVREVERQITSANLTRVMIEIYIRTVLIDHGQFCDRCQ
jgi:hypothetical protein